MEDSDLGFGVHTELTRYIWKIPTSVLGFIRSSPGTYGRIDTVYEVLAAHGNNMHDSNTIEYKYTSISRLSGPRALRGTAPCYDQQIHPLCVRDRLATSPVLHPLLDC
jgi:hypothetical protein